ncbi:VWA containing CoxE family protein, partial [Streptomyces sp. NPDC001948]
MTDHTTERTTGTTAPQTIQPQQTTQPARTPEADPQDNRRQVLYWRLLARLFDPEEQ